MIKGSIDFTNLSEGSAYIQAVIIGTGKAKPGSAVLPPNTPSPKKRP